MASGPIGVEVFFIVFVVVFLRRSSAFRWRAGAWRKGPGHCLAGAFGRCGRCHGGLGNPEP